MTRPLVETLENRRLLSASVLAKPLPFPHVGADYVGQAVLSTGTTEFVSFDLSHQTKGHVSGTINLTGSILAQQASGNVTRGGVLHVTAHAKKFTGKVIATVSGEGLSGTFTVTSGKVHYSGTFTASPVAI